MKWMIKVLIVTISLILPVLAFADSHMKTPPNIYVNPEGKIFIKSKTPLYLRLSTSPDPWAPAYTLRNQDSLDVMDRPKPFYTEGHGQHSIVHPPDHQNIQERKGPNLFYLHDDGRVPRIRLSVSKAPWVMNGKVNIYGKPVKITLKISDKDSGVFGGYTALNSDSFTEYSKPLSLVDEMDFKLLFYAYDNVGNKTKEFQRLYSLDFTPPITVFKVLGKQFIIGDEIVVGPMARIALKSRDLKAGVKQIRYRFKGKRGIYKNKPLDMKGLKDGPHNLVFAAEDRVLNMEANQTFTFYLDSIPPEVMYDILGDLYETEKKTFVSGRSKVEVTATDNKAGVGVIRYYLPLNKRHTYSAPFTFKAKNGPQDFAYGAIDRAGNASRRTKVSVVVDVSPPKVKAAFKGEHYYSRKTHYIRKGTSISLKASDNLSGVQIINFSLDDGTMTPDPEPFMISVEGLHKMVFNALDNVNNVTEDRMLQLFVDESAPEIFHHFGVNSTVAGEEVYPLKSLLYLAATDHEAGIRDIFYAIDGGKEKKYKGPLSFKNRRAYTIKIRSIDNIGNQSSEQISFQIK